jgi:hypothetical protein
MKVWLAESYDDTTYVFAQKGEDVGVLKMEMTGIFGNMLYDSGCFYEQLSTDDKLLFVEKTLWLLEQLECERKCLDDIKIENQTFDVPEWLLLDDWNEDNDFDLVVNTKTKSTFKFEYVEGKILATFINSNNQQCVKAKEFLDEMRKKDE